MPIEYDPDLTGNNCWEQGALFPRCPRAWEEGLRNRELGLTLNREQPLVKQHLCYFWYKFG